MPLPRFTYLKPKNLKEASALLAEHGDKARLMAGGTDLLIRMGMRAVTPEFVVGLGHLRGLSTVDYDPVKGLTIGALAKLNDVAEHPDVRRFYPAIAAGAAHTATVQIRNMGTVVGNICNAAPSADNATPLLVHGAEVVIIHPGGERILPLHEFFRGPGLTALETGELVKEIRVPVPPPGSGSNYQKISERSKVDIAAVGVSAMIELNEDGTCRKASIALGAVGPIPLRAGRAEKSLTGRDLTREVIADAAREAESEASPISDVRASGPYRRKMVGVLTARAVSAGLDLARENQAGCAQ